MELLIPEMAEMLVETPAPPASKKAIAVPNTPRMD